MHIGLPCRQQMDESVQEHLLSMCPVTAQVEFDSITEVNPWEHIERDADESGAQQQ